MISCGESVSEHVDNEGEVFVRVYGSHVCVSKVSAYFSAITCLKTTFRRHPPVM